MRTGGKLPEKPNSGSELTSGEKKRLSRRWIPILVFFGVVLFSWFFHRCSQPPISLPNPPDVVTTPGQKLGSLSPPPKPESVAVLPKTLGKKIFAPRETLATVSVKVDSVQDTIPFVYADPWGGRHFDSVTVTLHCREDCVLIYSLTDSLHFQSYAGPLTFRRSTPLWIAGITLQGHQSPAVYLDYVIEKNTKNCGLGSMPIGATGHEICVDIFEWPNQEGASPQEMVDQATAESSCQKVGKRLCSAEEWQEACQGPDRSRYPYGNQYDERYCSAQQKGPARSGYFPACRSYYGVYDLTGNHWEWTSTPDKDHEDYFLVAGGNWEAAEKATCSFRKYSFFPQNRYPGVGFRCCAEAK